MGETFHRFERGHLSIIYMYFNFPKVSIRVKFDGEIETGDLDADIVGKLKSYKGIFHYSPRHFIPFLENKRKLPSRLYYTVLIKDTDFSFADISTRKHDPSKKSSNEKHEFLRYMGEDEYGFHLYCGILSEESQKEVFGKVFMSPNDPKIIELRENLDFWWTTKG